jgi:four helix bundle protein
MRVEGLQRLEVWVKAREFAVIVHNEVLPLLPPEEKWAMAQQIRRSAQSIPANIAEGYGRYYYQDKVRFCYIARGSLNETLSHLILARDLVYISESLFTRLVRESESLVRLINGYIVT